MELPKSENPFAENSNSLTEITSDITSLKAVATVSNEPSNKSEIAEVFKVYEQEIGMITSFVRDDLLDALEQYPKSG